MKCTIALTNGKWLLKDENGKTWCAFSESHKDWAVEVAKSKGWTIC